MAFKLDLSPTYKWPVTGELPGENGPEPFKLSAYFKRHSQAEVDQLSEQARSGAISDAELVNTVLVRVDCGIEDATLEQVLSVAGVRNRVLIAWFDSVRGAPAGN
jgi:hypothetical protein